MKRDHLMRLIRWRAHGRGLDVVTREGGSHTVVRVGDRFSTVPRHREVAERLARTILRQLDLEEDS